jgi:hypothetical protein
MLRVPPAFSGDDDWLSEIEVPAPANAKESEDLIHF